jgi:glycosyltransferase involved in cell wall biosynthesis
LRIGVVFHKNPYAPPAGIDLVRLRAIAGGLIRNGIDTEIVSPVEREGKVAGFIPVRNIERLKEPGRYDLIKTCYHYSMDLIDGYRGPVVSRIVRVVDDRLPERDERFRKDLLRCQDLIRDRSDVLALNNPENRQRWLDLYGNRQRLVLVPTGCPAVIPEPGPDPYKSDLPVVLFLGSLSGVRMVEMINEAATRLRGRAVIHLVGKNKAVMYGCDSSCPLDRTIVDHSERPQNEIWDYIRHAHIGLALATGPHPFDNDVSKVLNYLRGGLPVLSEEPILNNHLVRETGYGTTFKHGDVDDLVDRGLELLKHPPWQLKYSVMSFMAEEHSWEQRVRTYVDLFQDMLNA